MKKMMIKRKKKKKKDIDKIKECDLDRWKKINKVDPNAMVYIVKGSKYDDIKQALD